MPAKKSKKPTAKKPAKKPAKKAPPKKAPAKKAKQVKKAAAKKVGKTAGKKAQKPPQKKAAPASKKQPATKAKTAPAKKAPAKKAPAKPAVTAAKPAKPASSAAAPKKAGKAAKAATPKAPSQKRLAPGRVGTVDLMTTDVDAAHKFYTTLFSWKTRPLEMPPLGLTKRIEANGREVGSMVSLPKAEGIPSHWMPYVMVPDLDAVVARAAALSGFAPVPATNLSDVGRFAVIADPRGAHVSPIALTGGVARAHQPGPGEPVWHEVHSDDVETTSTFFASVFGWDRTTMQMGEDADDQYTMLMNGDEQCAGAIENPHVPPQWLCYFLVKHIDTAFAAAKKLGATVVEDIMDIPGMGRSAILTDPTGAMFGLFEGQA